MLKFNLTWFLIHKCLFIPNLIAIIMSERFVIRMVNKDKVASILKTKESEYYFNRLSVDSGMSGFKVQIKKGLQFFSGGGQSLTVGASPLKVSPYPYYKRLLTY